MVRAVHTHDWTGDINPLFHQSGTPMKSTSGLAPECVPDGQAHRIRENLPIMSVHDLASHNQKREKVEVVKSERKGADRRMTIGYVPMSHLRPRKSSSLLSGMTSR